MAFDMTRSKNNSGLMVWMDLEMTGLDPEIDEIIEIATLITDGDLNIIAEGPELVLHQPSERFEKMDQWNKDQHTKSGLWEQVLASQVSMADAEQQTLAFLKEHIAENSSPLCGNSVWQDRRFLRRYMPSLESYLHYRLVDVSTIKELGQRWYGDKARFTKNVGSHRAMDDIRESILELKFYRDQLFKPAEE